MEKAEIDFVLQRQNDVAPIEVKAEENLKSKSLRVHADRYEPSRTWRFSMADYRQQDKLTNLPLYALPVFERL